MPLLTAALCRLFLPLPLPTHLSVDVKAVRRFPQTVQHCEATELGSAAWENRVQTSTDGRRVKGGLCACFDVAYTAILVGSTHMYWVHSFQLTPAKCFWNESQNNSIRTHIHMHKHTHIYIHTYN